VEESRLLLVPSQHRLPPVALVLLAGALPQAMVRPLLVVTVRGSRLARRARVPRRQRRSHPSLQRGSTESDACRHLQQHMSMPTHEWRASKQTQARERVHGCKGTSRALRALSAARRNAWHASLTYLVRSSWPSWRRSSGGLGRFGRHVSWLSPLSSTGNHPRGHAFNGAGAAKGTVRQRRRGMRAAARAVCSLPFPAV
jgi:hypothetical protein